MKSTKLNEAIILAAGFGKRLQPLTNLIPKPLVTIFGIPGIIFVLMNLRKNGIHKYLINSFHLSNLLKKFLILNLEQDKFTQITESKILGTGGGISNFANHISNDNFVVYNSDVISNINLKPAYSRHLEAKNLATLVLIDHQKKNSVIVNADNQIESFLNPNSDQSNEQSFCFTGISIINKRIFKYLPQNEYSDVISIYRNLMKTKIEKIGSYIVEKDEKKTFWFDYGTFDELKDLHENKKYILRKKFPIIDEINETKHNFLEIDNFETLQAKIMKKFL